MFALKLMIICIIFDRQTTTVPIDGEFSWTVLLCNIPKSVDIDQNLILPDPRYIDQWLNDERLDGSVANYFKLVSNNRYRIKDCQIIGWYTVPWSMEQIESWAESDPRNKTSQEKLHYQVKELCASYAMQNFGQILQSRVITIVNDMENGASYSKENGILSSVKNLLSTALTHEMVHSFHIGHSYSDRQVRIFGHASLGEYDNPFDLMSASHVFTYNGKIGIQNGPGLSGPHLDYLGWLPMTRMLWFNGRGRTQVRLSSLSYPHSSTRDWLLIMIPYDQNDPTVYYSIEYRTKTFLDSGQPVLRAILVHKVERRNKNLYAILMTHEDKHYLEAGQMFFKDGLEIFVDFLDYNGSATLTIKLDDTAISHQRPTFGLNACLNDDDKWRQNDPYDFSCVGQESRSGQYFYNVPLQCTSSKRSFVECNSTFCDGQKKLCMCKSSLKETCAKRNLKIVYFNVSNTTPRLGDTLHFTCCLNLEPKSVSKLKFLHNETRELRHQSKKPSEIACWNLETRIFNFTLSGLYTCKAFSTSSNGQTFVDEKSLPVHVLSSLKLNLAVEVLDSSSLRIHWSLDGPHFSGVRVKVESIDHQIVYKNTTAAESSSQILVQNLQPAARYTVTVETVQFKNNASIVERADVTTKEDFPDPPILVDKGGQLVKFNNAGQAGRCNVKWKIPKFPRGRILHYELELRGVLRRQLVNNEILVSDHLAISSSANCQNLSLIDATNRLIECRFDTNLLPNRNYTLKIWSVNSAGKSKTFIQSLEHCLTGFGLPSRLEAPNKIQKDLQSKSITVHFDNLVDESSGPISCYYLAIVPLSLNKKTPQSPKDVEFDSYETIASINLTVNSRPLAYIAESYQRLPEYTIVGDQIDQSNRCSVYYLSKYRSYDGPLKSDVWYTGFLIAWIDIDESTRSKRFIDESSSQRPLYKFSDFFQPVYMGDSGMTITAVLQSSTTENFTTNDVEISQQTTVRPHVEESSMVLALTLIIIFLLLILAAILVIFYKNGWLEQVRKNAILLFRRTQDSLHEMQHLPKDFPPIPVENLVEEYRKKHKNSDFLLTVEFESLPHYTFETVHSDRPENNAKNRYNDIKAYDLNRVVLEKINNDANSDYINANFVKVNNNKKTFIAAQGPLQDTVNDFWRMIYEKDVRIVIMVTNLQERYRTMCVKYWPEQGSATYGDLEISSQDCQHFSDYVVRKFLVKKMSYSNLDCDQESDSQVLLPTAPENPKPSHTVVHYHYTGWNDYRAPDGTIGLLKFLKNLKHKVDDYARTLVLVHCSAGVGRTGTFIALDALLDQAEESGLVDIFGVVADLRRQRNFMVQSLEQYVFVYKALAEHYLFGDTDIEAENLENRLQFLSQTDNLGQTNLQLEYQKLEHTLDDPRTFDMASNRHNLPKNRFHDDFVPFDRNRVILQPVLGEVDASYINASVIKGYFHPYILTQDPTSTTIWDFWRMVLEQKAVCIVNLTDEKLIPTSEKYWPQDLGRNASFGSNPSINVQFQAEDLSQNCKIRRFNVTSQKINGEIREIYQFCYTDWPKDVKNENTVENGYSIPRSAGSLLDLIGKVLQKQSSALDPGTSIVVHCNDGSSKSGLYVAVSLLLERLRAEQRVDVFQTVKTLQAQRQHVIDCLEQYEFCYQAVMDYLQSFQ